SEPAFLPIILWRFGPKRLSPSLVVWQVRHALLNVCCPDSVAAPLAAGSWGTARKPRSTRNVVQTNPRIAVRGMTCSCRLNFTLPSQFSDSEMGGGAKKIKQDFWSRQIFKSCETSAPTTYHAVLNR